MTTSANSKPISQVIQQSIVLLKKHPAVIEVSDISVNGENQNTMCLAHIRVRLPSSWKKDGKSPNGVLEIEPVTLVFPSHYPVKPPDIQLRQDFNRSLPHIQPGRPSTPIIPCLFEGDINEMFHAEQIGLWFIIDQLVVWLEKAAQGTLIDPNQGWEPIRRDNLDSYVVADSNQLRELVSKDEKHYFFEISYLKLRLPLSASDFSSILHGQIGSGIKVNQDNFSKLFLETRYIPEISEGKSIVILATPGKYSNGKPHIADQYHPEDVCDLTSLKNRAEEYGCAKSLENALSHLQHCARRHNSSSNKCPVIVILCARRPYNLIGHSSDIELVPYLIEIKAPNLFVEGNLTHVVPVYLQEPVTPALLQKFSGETVQKTTHKTVMIGCGSLGSKIAVHMARSGYAPSVVIDKRSLTPHNAARHALLPHSGKLAWMGNKSSALAAAIERLGQTTKAIYEDVTLIADNPKLCKTLFPHKSWVIINSTASLAARETLAATRPQSLSARVIETCLYASGSVGLMTVEGANRNPNSMDLIAAAYEAIRTNSTLQKRVFSGENPMEWHQTGQGCGSITMAMPDSRISLFAAAMAQGIATLHTHELPATSGRISLGEIDDSGMSLHWKHLDVPPVHIIPIENSSWTVRLSEAAHQKIQQDCANTPNVEAGGIIVGRVSNVMQSFLITDVLPAPADSTRSAFDFTLGVEGVSKALEAYQASCQSALYALGTWHSHLRDSPASDRDRQTASEIASSQPLLSVLLIRTPQRYLAILSSPLDL